MNYLYYDLYKYDLYKVLYTIYVTFCLFLSRVYVHYNQRVEGLKAKQLIALYRLLLYFSQLLFFQRFYFFYHKEHLILWLLKVIEYISCMYVLSIALLCYFGFYWQNKVSIVVMYLYRTFFLLNSINKLIEMNDLFKS